MSAGPRCGKPSSACRKRGCSKFYRSAGPSYLRFTRNSWQSSAFFRVTLERSIVELACQDFPDPWRTKLEFCIFEQGKFIISKDAEKFFKSDNTLHSLLYEGCGKPHIWQIVQESNLDYARARVLNVSDAAEQMNLLYEQHKNIVGAIFAGNTELAKHIMTEHIDKVMGDVEVLKKEYPEYFR